MMWGYDNDYMMHNGYLSWGLGWLVSLIFWVVIIILIVWAVKWILHGGTVHHKMQNMPKEDSAMQILRDRYARDEISKEDFEIKKKDLMKKE